MKVRETNLNKGSIPSIRVPCVVDKKIFPLSWKTFFYTYYKYKKLTIYYHHLFKSYLIFLK
jgi:hypothetical protein